MDHSYCETTVVFPEKEVLFSVHTIMSKNPFASLA